jgi:hypothetical protein
MSMKYETIPHLVKWRLVLPSPLIFRNVGIGVTYN